MPAGASEGAMACRGDGIGRGQMCAQQQRTNGSHETAPRVRVPEVLARGAASRGVPCTLPRALIGIMRILGIPIYVFLYVFNRPVWYIPLLINLAQCLIILVGSIPVNLTH